jgi:hypothetical protein
MRESGPQRNSTWLKRESDQLRYIAQDIKYFNVIYVILKKNEIK